YTSAAVGALLLAGHLSDWYGRRRLLLPALGVAIVSAIVFLVWKSLPGLLVGRLLNGIAIGIIVATATAYMTELHAVGSPDETPRRAQLTASAIPVGRLGPGGLLAARLREPRRRDRTRRTARGDPRAMGDAPAHGAVSGAPRGAPVRRDRSRSVARD